MTDASRPEKQGAANSLLNGLSVLEAFSSSPGSSLGVTEISALVGLHKSTVSRMLAGLTEAGYVQRDDTNGRYRLGLAMIGLAGPLLAELDVRRAAIPHLEEMTARTGETSALSVWNGAEAVVVEQMPSPQYVKHSASIGTRYQRVGSSSVRVFLAHLAASRVDELLSSGQIESTGYTGRDDPLHDRLEETRRDGFAVNDGETHPDEYGVSAPIADYRGSVVGCVTASAPRARVLRSDAGEVLREAAMATAALISRRLGTARVD